MRELVHILGFHFLSCISKRRPCSSKSASSSTKWQKKNSWSLTNFSIAISCPTWSQREVWKYSNCFWLSLSSPMKWLTLWANHSKWQQKNSPNTMVKKRGKLTLILLCHICCILLFWQWVRLMKFRTSKNSPNYTQLSTWWIRRLKSDSWWSSSLRFKNLVMVSNTTVLSPLRTSKTWSSKYKSKNELL